MKIYFNGCSFTYGDELSDPAKHAWPTLVANALHANFLNDAVSGGTNQRTVYKTLCNKDQYDYFVIAWSTYTRFTEYNPVDNFEINFNPALNLNTNLHYSTDLKENFSKYKEFGKLYYTHWFNELYEFKKWLQQILLLQSFFELHQKKYIMLNTTSNNLRNWLQSKEKFISSTRHLISFFDYIDDTTLLDEWRIIQSLASDINTSTFIDWNKWAIIDLTNQFATGPGGHILDAGHTAVAEKVITYIKDNDSN
jgi:hypothetical protein